MVAAATSGPVGTKLCSLLYCVCESVCVSERKPSYLASYSYPFFFFFSFLVVFCAAWVSAAAITSQIHVLVDPPLTLRCSPL